MVRGSRRRRQCVLVPRTWSTNDAPEKLVSGVTVDDNVITSGGHVFPAGTGVFITYAKDSV
ncbi:MAG: hypothetical protein ACOX7Q_08710 [Kiritimatiellia bacterium]